MAPLDESDPSVLGPYAVLGRLGDGGMGSIYLARRGGHAGDALLTVEELIGLLERHQRTPLTLLDLKGLFEHPGNSLAEIDELYDAAENSVALIAKIVALLYREANDEDPIGEGCMSLENLHYAIRKELSPRRSQMIVNEALTFLASSLVKAVAANGEKCKLVDSPSNIRRRLLRPRLRPR
ncbi:hypothetical protein [Pseudofrankia sp. BMG5.36]|uniref:hypothetical protein n=1 Tax=Pseudofrankia sp. BMG5.36 TaxID=1834512 RepID=UPI0010421461|nr:hypothetical protein [Pseudofrankia sp. BMG5.36]